MIALWTLLAVLAAAGGQTYRESASSGPLRVELRGVYREGLKRDSARIVLDARWPRGRQRLVLEDAYPYAFLSIEDYDLDGRADIQVYHDCGPTGSCGATVWLFDPVRGRFRRSEEFSGYPGLDVDPEARVVRRDRWFGAGSYGFTKTYRVAEGRLQLVESVEVQMLGNGNPDIRTRRIYDRGRLLYAKTEVVDWEKEPEP